MFIYKNKHICSFTLQVYSFFTHRHSWNIQLVKLEQIPSKNALYIFFLAMFGW